MPIEQYFFGSTDLIAMVLHLLNMHKPHIKLCEVRVFGGELSGFWCTFLLFLKISTFVSATVGLSRVGWAVKAIFLKKEYGWNA